MRCCRINARIAWTGCPSRCQRLDFVGAGHHTTVVVGQHHDRFSLQTRREHPFTGHIEIVGIDQADDARRRDRPKGVE